MMEVWGPTMSRACSLRSQERLRSPPSSRKIKSSSSLHYLRRYPVHTVKLDRSFLDEVPQNDSAGALVESVITMAHSLGKRVTAEGVESGAQLEFLRSRGCEAAQGFFLARPMSAAALTEILESRRPGSEIADERAAG